MRRGHTTVIHTPEKRRTQRWIHRINGNGWLCPLSVMVVGALRHFTDLDLNRASRVEQERRRVARAKWRIKASESNLSMCGHVRC